MSLYVESTTVEDMGEYSVMVTTRYGSVTSRAYVAVDYDAPSFARPLADTPFRVGDSVTLTCEPTGLPAPRVDWLVAGVPVGAEPGRYVVDETEDGSRRLTITELTQDDAEMTYTCRARNAAGQATCEARLFAQGWCDARASAGARQAAALVWLAAFVATAALMHGSRVRVLSTVAA